ncbi:MAG: hypothetical protein WCA78_12810, partial [Rhizomicrobium sp.]
YNYRSDIETKAPPLSLVIAIPLNILLCAGYFVVVVYVLKRGDNWIFIGLFGGWIFFGLGFSLLTFQKCPSFLQSIYSTLPICRYEPPPF